MELSIPQWGLRKRVGVYRKHVSHKSRKNFQLDLFSPDDGHYEYTAVITNKTIGVAALWHFLPAEVPTRRPLPSSSNRWPSMRSPP